METEVIVWSTHHRACPGRRQQKVDAPGGREGTTSGAGAPRRETAPEEEGIMMCSSRFWRRATVAMVVLAAAGLMMAGCSSMGPEGSTELGTGSVSGTVTTYRGVAIPEIEVTMYGGHEGTEYTAETSQSGVFSIAELQMSAKHVFNEDYEIWVNRTRTTSTPIDPHFGTYYGMVQVSKDQTVTCSVRLERIDDEPGDPEQIVENH
jgi:hypothetical protein